MNERVATFGPDEAEALIGIETLPPEGTGSAERPAILILNAGVVLRVGPHRITVRMARRLAREGFHVLRFDLAGLGDSGRRNISSSESPNVQDVRRAMDYLEQSAGAKRFVLIGICSGADNGIKTAAVDPRVVGVVMLDAYAYRTLKFYWLKLRSRGHDWDAWTGFARRASRAAVERVRARFPHADSEAAALRVQASQLNVRYIPPKREFAEKLRTVVDRGTRCYIIYTANASDKYSYPEQFDDGFRRFGLEGRICCEYWPNVNHTFTELAMQERLFAAVTAWTRQHWVR